jgi:hypothetical protein
MHKLLVSLLALSSLAACSNSASDSGQAETVGDKAPAPTVFDPMLQTMDRAQDAANLSLTRKEELDRQMEGQ